jgi:hypothetical protein
MVDLSWTRAIHMVPWIHRGNDNDETAAATAAVHARHTMPCTASIQYMTCTSHNHSAEQQASPVSRYQITDNRYQPHHIH